jgi:Leucine-rich repeat (LRR) protein
MDPLKFVRQTLNQPSVHSLHLPHANLKDNRTKEIVRALCTNSTITSLDLKYNHIGVAGMEALAALLRENTTITELNVWGNKFEWGGVKALALALCSNRTILKLDLGSNNLGERGAQELAAALCINVSVTELHLSLTALGPKGATKLAQALRSNTSITDLDLSGNNMGVDGMKALVEALHRNSSIQVLNVEENHIKDEGAKALASLLRTNTTLTKLNIMNNDIGPEGGRVLVDALCINFSITRLNLVERNYIDEATLQELFENNYCVIEEVTFEEETQPAELKLRNKMMVEGNYYTRRTEKGEWYCINGRPTSILELSVPSFPSKGPQLTKVVLRGCKLSDIPRELYTLQQLTMLDLGFNDIRTIEVRGGLDKLTNLQRLWLPHNQLESLPSDLALLCCSESSTASQSSLSPSSSTSLSFPSPQLKELNIVDNPGLCLPRILFKGKYLQMLLRWLRGWNQWDPLCHLLFPRPFQDVVMTILLAVQRDQYGNPRHPECGLTVLPIEIIYHIINFLPGNAFGNCYT